MSSSTTFTKTAQTKKELTRSDYLEREIPLSTVSMPRLEQLLHKCSTDEWPIALRLMSPTQRQYLWDQACWIKDDFCMAQFKFWSVIVGHLDCENSDNEQILKQFVTSENFLVYIKSVYTISLIDPEDPVFPDHDHYFTTDDGQFVFEYLLVPEMHGSEEELEADLYALLNTTQLLLKQFYNHYGVNQAYFILHTLTGEQYLSFLEDKYQENVRRMELLGLPSYVKSLEIQAAFNTKSEIDFFIKKILERKLANPVDIEMFTTKSIEKVLPPNYCWDVILEKDLRLEEYPQWAIINLSQIVNSLIILEKAKVVSFDYFLSASQLRHFGKLVHVCLQIGKEYINCDAEKLKNFSFQEIYKVGKSLINVEQIRLKKLIKSWPAFEQFCGEYWEEFVEKSLLDLPCLKLDHHYDAPAISCYSDYQKWGQYIDALEEQFPIMQLVHTQLKKLISENAIHDSFYSTIKVAQMDFQNITTSSIINFLTGHQGPKLGVLESDFNEFQALKVMTVVKLDAFLETFGLAQKNHKVLHEKIFRSFITNIDENCVILFAKDH